MARRELERVSTTVLRAAYEACQRGELAQRASLPRRLRAPEQAPRCRLQGLPRDSAMKLVDRTGNSPTDIRVRTRQPSEVDLVCLHQTATPYRDPSSPRLDLTSAHLLVLDDGEVRLLHPLLTRLRVGSRWWNSRCVTVEVRANLPTRYTSKGEPVWWRPDIAGADKIEDKAVQVRAVRELLKWLRGELPSLKYVGAHRQIEAAKPGCCGPDLFSECAVWAVEHYGYEVAPTDPRGLELLPTWTRPPRIADVE